jgi:hypothetical protein
LHYGGFFNHFLAKFFILQLTQAIDIAIMTSRSDPVFERKIE